MQRHRSGSVALDNRIRTWHFFYWENGKRRSKRIGTLSQFPPKASAWRAAKPLRDAVETQTQVNPITSAAPTVRTLVEQYRVEKMPKRKMTRQGYNTWLTTSFRRGATGQWSEGIEDRILDAVLPATNVHIGLAASRTPRPNWSKPAEAQSGESGLAITGIGDPTARDWVRLAWVEGEYVHDPASRYAPPVEKVTVFAGATILLPSITLPGRITFFDADHLRWFEAPGKEDRAMGWPLMGLVKIDDWLGEALFPTPPGFLIASLRLTAAQPGKSLCWRNAAGESVLALRTWFVRNDGTLSANTSPLMGADVIANPDFVREIERLIGGKLRETCVVQRRSLRRKNDQDTPTSR